MEMSAQFATVQSKVSTILITYVLEGYPKPVLKILGIKDNFGYFFGDKRIGIR